MLLGSDWTLTHVPCLGLLRMSWEGKGISLYWERGNYGKGSDSFSQQDYESNRALRTPRIDGLD